MMHADEIREAINHLKLENKDYQSWVYSGTNSAQKINSRVNVVMNIMTEIIYGEKFADGQNDKKRQFDPALKSQLFYPGYVCSYCGNCILSIDDCEIDHIIPFDMGGSTTAENAQLLHKWCNRSKGDRIQAESDFEDDSQETDEDGD